MQAFLEMSAVGTQLGDATCNFCTLPPPVLNTLYWPRMMPPPSRDKVPWIFLPRLACSTSSSPTPMSTRSPGSMSRDDGPVSCEAGSMRCLMTMTWLLALQWLLQLVNKLICTETLGASLVAQMVKSLPAMQKTQV